MPNATPNIQLRQLHLQMKITYFELPEQLRSSIFLFSIQRSKYFRLVVKGIVLTKMIDFVGGGDLSKQDHFNTKFMI